jgi:hypothetical protein
MILRVAILFIATTRVFAQVANNNIEQRLQLDLNKPVNSSTAGASVQWKCINKALTNKCLVYHNDQWFSFNIEKTGDYFINISSQSCRDSKGVQLIIIEGNPCEVSTYKILDCIPQIRTEDVFVQLTSLKARTQYLVNIDGFLGDFCQFNIELSEKPKGLPRNDVNLDTLEINSHLEQKVVTMEWTVDGQIANDLSTFKIVRQADKSRANVVSEISLGRNAYGVTTKKYQFTDTLNNPGVYKYNIYGIRESDDMPLLLSERKFEVKPEPSRAKESSIVKILPLRLMFKEHDLFQLRLYNYDGDHLLWKHDGEAQGEGELFMIDPQPYAAYGVKKFQLLILDGDGNKIDEIYFRVDGDGRVIKE